MDEPTTSGSDPWNNHQFKNESQGTTGGGMPTSNRRVSPIPRNM